MKKGYKQLALFLVLMLVLASGLSYLSLHHVTKKQDPQDVQTMSIALVNEDQGTMFNNYELNFGDAFVKGMDKNNDQDWYVVSRGVAENGLEENTYDMMIVIPNDFSKKALSIDSDSPEQVELNYKINASKNEDVKARAEKTASSVLNDFNRRIIDVYFASVIGHLQNAQDNIGGIIDKEAEYTYTYNNDIHDPLANYTNQFQTVKNSTKISKDSFSGFENTLDSFNNSLSDRVDSAQDYLSSINDTAQLHQANSALSMNFLDQLNQYQGQVNSADIEEQLNQLQAANQMISQQFQKRQDDSKRDMRSIVTDTRMLRARLQDALDTVNQAQKNVDQMLETDILDDKVGKKLSKIIGDAFNSENGDMSANKFFDYADNNTREYIETQISKLPTLDENVIEGSGLSQGTVTEIKNVLAITKKYKDEFGSVESDTDEDKILNVQALKDYLHKTGVTMTDSVILPENKKSESGQIFELHDIPDEFTVERLALQLPNQQEANYTDAYYQNHQIKLPANVKGKFNVKLTLRLKDPASDIDVYQLAKWSWSLHQKDITDADEPDEYTLTTMPNTPLVASMTEEKGNDNKGEDNSTQQPDASDNKTDEEQPDDKDTDEKNDDTDQPADKDNQDKDKDNQDKADTDDNEDNQPDDNEKESEQPGNPKDDNDTDAYKDKNEDQDENKEANKGDEGDKDDDEIEKVEVINNTIHHEVASPVIDEATKDLIHAVTNTIGPYQKLLASYETYFGIDLTCDNAGGPGACSTVGNNGKRLEDIASKSSLYYLFNKKDTDAVLADYVIGRIKAGVTEEVRQPLENLRNRITAYQAFVEKTDENAEQLAQKVSDTTDAAALMNESLGKTLESITNWREQSMDLVENHAEIQQNNDQEQTAVMSLGQQFQPLLMQSQALADQASGNLQSASRVYQTFDTIDDQASAIQDSGVALVNKAKDLSTNMTNKVLDDQEFADNFTGVLANSRIGDRQNEDLYDFLSNPVETKNQGIILAGDTFTPYFLVLICFIVALFTAYVISLNNQRRTAGDQFEHEQSLMGKNALITGITASIGIAEGLVIGLVSGYFLGINNGQLMMWTGLIILIMLAMLLVSSYLLRQIKMIGMFILLAMLSVYLLLTKALGSGLGGVDTLRMYSPLQYVETLMTKVTQGDDGYFMIMMVMIGVILVGALANLLVIHRSDKSKSKDDEHVAEAN
ncbi:type VII secretion protein EsaA [Lentibacillus sp. L22]|uniref:type VII secretion protein EsaA n=1 Tax=Lentibacillus TaxID=175304 RepID=UPI0022B0D8FC|nr:type VII secretion protein EsaA [Lentibacillus daqui]